MTKPIPFAVLIGRILLSLIFVMSSANKIMNFTATAEEMTSEGVPASSFVLIIAIAMELAGGLMVLLGWKGRVGATVLLLFLIPVTFVYHDFWTYEGQERQMQMINFMKNLSIMGGLTFLLGMGSGPASLDHRVPVPSGTQ